jgi:hypothetical protein
MSIEEMPNGVKINNTFIPAINVQVDGFPSWHPHKWLNNASEAWYPMYFELMFERGDLWVITYGDNPEEPDKIMLEVHKNWATSPSVDPDLIIYPDNWEHFVRIYKATLEHGLGTVA